MLTRVIDEETAPKDRMRRASTVEKRKIVVSRWMAKAMTAMATPWATKPQT